MQSFENSYYKSSFDVNFEDNSNEKFSYRGKIGGVFSIVKDIKGGKYEVFKD